MKKLYLSKIFFLIAFFIMTSVFRSVYTSVDLMTLEYLLFWIGGFLGLVLADVDHLVYVYFLRPDDVTSKEVGTMIQGKKFRSSLELLAKTRKERTGHIFHTAIFQLVFLAFAVFVLTSSGSFLGQGIVLGFLLGLLVDQATDLSEGGTINSWFKDFPITLDAKHQRWFMAGNVATLVLIALFL